jgi:hypothetical protein
MWARAIHLAICLVALSSCKNRVRDEKMEAWKAELAKSVEAFKNRKIYDGTAQTIRRRQARLR